MAAVLLSVSLAAVVWVCCFLLPVTADCENINKCACSCDCLGNNVDCSSKGFINIPPDVPKWAERLELQSNAITEIRPEDLKGLPNLKYLDLGKNDIKMINGTVFRDLPGLKTLKLDYNQLTEIPLVPAPLNIEELSLSQNHVYSIPLATMSNLPHLKILDLSNNNIMTIANGSFPDGSKLTHLNLIGNRIAALDKGSMSNLTYLETLKMNKNKLTELLPGVFSGLHSLKTLELMRNEIQMLKSLTFKDLLMLQNLKLKRNSISLISNGAFVGLENMENLFLDHNDITNVTNNWMLFGLKKLKNLSLGHNKISTIQAGAWQKVDLGKLDLAHNRLSAVTEDLLRNLQSLQELKLDHNHITRIAEKAFGDLKQLTNLDLQSNRIRLAQDVDAAFTGLSSLTSLRLQDNAVDDIAAHAFLGMPRLKFLHLDGNNITTIHENAFENQRDLRKLTFNSSKLLCDCLLAWLPLWLEHNNFQANAGGICFYPPPLQGRPLADIDAVDFQCKDSDFPKPVILESPKSENASKGQNLTLTCVTAITGDGKPAIQWRKNNQLLDRMMSEVIATSDGRVKRYTSHLRLYNIEGSAAGKYQCQVSNELSKVFSKKADVVVYVHPVFVIKPKDVTVKAGKPAELKCAAAGEPLPQISWQKDGGDNFPAARERRITVYPNDNHFYILNTRVADEGVYSCTAKNGVGKVVTNATVTVLETPDFVQPMKVEVSTQRGKTTVLQCMASGSPQPKLTWLKDDKELVMTPRHFFTVDNQILVIVDTQWSDAGLYACRMSNSLGTAKGATQLEVLSATGELSDTSGSSFGLDDESTTTGIIIIAVVCCVVGTSLVWVIIIYQTRKRHEMYSATPTDETTLPGEVPSSGYMSSDKEGSYSQGPITIGSYHYTDYQMKESGYESSSGQFRANGFPRPATCPSDVDEDENKPPMLTKGDRLLRKMNSATSASSLRYAGSDGDTIGSRHSSSSGQHSGSSDPSSSGSLSPQIPLAISTASNCDEYQRVYPSPGSDDSQDFSNLRQQNATLTEIRPVLQTFHPTKMPHEKQNSTNNVGKASDSRTLEGRCRGSGNRQCRHSDSCDNRVVESSGAHSPHCVHCLHSDTNSNSIHSHPVHSEIHLQNSRIPFPKSELDSVNIANEIKDSTNTNINKKYLIDNKPPLNPFARSVASQTGERKGRSPPSYYEVCRGKKVHSGPRGGGSLDRESAKLRYHHCRDSEALRLERNDPVTNSSPRTPTPTPCCCEVVRDIRYCPSHPSHSRNEKTSDPQHNLWEHQHSTVHRGYKPRKRPGNIERSRSSNSVGLESVCCPHCDNYTSVLQPDQPCCSCHTELASVSTSPVCGCRHCHDNAKDVGMASNRLNHKRTPSHSHLASRSSKVPHSPHIPATSSSLIASPSQHNGVDVR